MWEYQFELPEGHYTSKGKRIGVLYMDKNKGRLSEREARLEAYSEYIKLVNEENK